MTPTPHCLLSFNSWPALESSSFLQLCGRGQGQDLVCFHLFFFSFIFLMAIDTHSKIYLLTNVGELNKHPQTIVALHLLIERCGVPAHRCTATPSPFQVFLTVVYYVQKPKGFLVLVHKLGKGWGVGVRGALCENLQKEKTWFGQTQLCVCVCEGVSNFFQFCLAKRFFSQLIHFHLELVIALLFVGNHLSSTHVHPLPRPGYSNSEVMSFFFSFSH